MNVIHRKGSQITLRLESCPEIEALSGFNDSSSQVGYKQGDQTGKLL